MLKRTRLLPRRRQLGCLLLGSSRRALAGRDSGRMQHSYGDLTDAVLRDPCALFDGEWVVGGLQLDERPLADRSGASVGLQVGRALGVERELRAESAEVRLLRLPALRVPYVQGTGEVDVNCSAPPPGPAGPPPEPRSSISSRLVQLAPTAQQPRLPQPRRVRDRTHGLTTTPMVSVKAEQLR